MIFSVSTKIPLHFWKNLISAESPKTFKHFNENLSKLHYIMCHLLKQNSLNNLDVFIGDSRSLLQISIIRRRAKKVIPDCEPIWTSLNGSSQLYFIALQLLFVFCLSHFSCFSPGCQVTFMNNTTSFTPFRFALEWALGKQEKPFMGNVSVWVDGSVRVLSGVTSCSPDWFKQ